MCAGFFFYEKYNCTDAGYSTAACIHFAGGIIFSE